MPWAVMFPRSPFAMKVQNVHERVFPVSSNAVGALVDSLASRNDRLWPRELWPPMKLDKQLEVGASGGHGPIRYSVAQYLPGRSVIFRFTAPSGFIGTHRYEVISLGKEETLLRHVLEMRTSGLALLSWPLVFRPLHDALIEDSFDRAQVNLGLKEKQSSWSLTVRILRWLASGGTAKNQKAT